MPRTCVRVLGIIALPLVNSFPGPGKSSCSRRGSLKELREVMEAGLEHAEIVAAAYGVDAGDELERHLAR